MSDDQMDRVDHVAYVDTEKPTTQREIQDSFFHCGTISGIYPDLPEADGNCCRFFLEFRQKHSVKRARALQIPGIQVQALGFCPLRVLERYKAIRPPLPDHSTPSHPNVKSESRDGDLPRRPSPPYRYPHPKYQSYRRQSPPEYRYSNFHGPGKARRGFRGGKFASAGRYKAHGSSPYSSPSMHAEGEPSYKRPRRAHWTETDRDKENYSSPAIPYAASLREHSHASSSNHPQVHPHTSIAPTSGHVPEPTLCSSEDNTSTFATSPATSMTSAGAYPTPSITLIFRGERIVCELDNLTEDPSQIIVVLKATAGQCSERDKWIVVAGHYRNRGNVAAAAAIVSAMIEVMTSVGETMQDLKPALLMLGSCHVELAKRLRSPEGTDTPASTEHFAKAQECFRRVYGPCIPPSQTDDDNPVAECLGDASVAMMERQRRHLQDASNLQMLNKGEHGVSNTDISALRGRIGVLERDICALQDRQKHSTHQLNELYGAKRIVEDELESVRESKRKLECKIEDISQELSTSVRREKYASERCLRLETRLEEVKEEARWERRETEAKVEERDKKVKECFGKLGILFLKAAKGEVEESDMKHAFADYVGASGRSSER